MTIARRNQSACCDAGKPIGSNDLLIAAHAYATGATIATANTDEFKVSVA